ncbi:MAG: S-methyl-5'-thioadenosine phosphorylase [Candidatus Omnitrophica bacterium]|nr:S-methyl-5'-thioadenosine phosphorylase [Candidatus Omnitrophota bacterium]
MTKIGVIGGSALYNIESLEVDEKVKVETPFGEPSGEYMKGKLSGKEVVFLARHGEGHRLMPSEINYRANIYGFKVLGVDRIIAISAVGSLKEELKPLDMLLVDQFIDRTNSARRMTFFGEGIVAHISFAEPVCPSLRAAIYDLNAKMPVKIHRDGTYINMEGPAFSTKAESELYRSWGADVIGMTNIAEARLAREAGLCYASIAMITDYDCWREGPSAECVTVEMIIANLMKNAETSKKMLLNTVAGIPGKRTCSCMNALKDAIITSKDAIPRATLDKLGPIVKGFI